MTARSLNLPPVFGWGGRIAPATAMPQQRYPGWLNINRTQDVAISLTKVFGRHTIKAGYYLNHSFKAQNMGAGGGDAANLSFQGWLNFGNDTNNTLDTGFGYANALTGIFTNYTQMSRFIEGSLIYDQTEFYVQDNWKVSNRLTLDYGMRFVHQQPQHDQFQQMSNFFPEQWTASQAPVLYVAGCSNGATMCSGNIRNAMDPRTGQILTAVGAANTQAAIGTPIAGTGNSLNGIKQAGDGIVKTNYKWPALVLGPRFGFAYDVLGDQTLGGARRRRAVLRPAGREHDVLDPQQSADRDIAGPPQRAAGNARAGVGAEPAADADADHLPVRGEDTGVVAVAGGHPEVTAVGDLRGRDVCGQPRVQPHGVVPGRTASEL